MFCLNIRENVFPVSVKAVEQAAQRSCRLSLPRKIQNLPRHDTGQNALGDPALTVGVGLYVLQ